MPNDFLLKHYGDEEFADFTLKSSDGKMLKVHRMIMADKSEYFKRMLTTDMQEKESNLVWFNDINSSTLKELVKFIYTGKATIADNKMAKDLLYAAEKFGLEALKSFCASSFDVKKENVLKIFATAVQFNAKELEEKCLEMILE
jgi:hypothetical protein